MKCFLTSSPVLADTNELNPANGFLDKLKTCIPPTCKTLFICSDPNSHERTVRFAEAVKESFESAGFCFDWFTVLDGQNPNEAADWIRQADLIILAGGHVPTQNRFFSSIHLKNLLHTFEGTLIGISAGSMNSAETVYAQPELEGEATDPTYQKYLPGLGLTDKMILPHYQLIKDHILDGLRVMEDITYPDSYGKRFYALPDGSYLYTDGITQTICGEAYLIADGKLSQISQAENCITV